MKVTLLFFGVTTDLVGMTQTEFETSEGLTVSKFKTKLQEVYPSLAHIESYAIAVNESYASDDLTLKPNDIVAIIPPVSGG